MITKTFAKTVSYVDHLTQQLHSNGFPSAIAVQQYCAHPCLYVHYEASEGDPTAFVNAYVDPPRISATSNHAVGPFGHFQGLANGVDSQAITISMLNANTGQPMSWNGNVIIQPMAPITISTNTLAIVNGTGVFTVGPTTIPSEYDIWIQLQTDPVGYTRYRLHLSFF